MFSDEMALRGASSSGVDLLQEGAQGTSALTGEVVRGLPDSLRAVADVILAASGDVLGIIALLIFAFAVIALVYVLKKGAPQKHRLAVVILSLGMASLGVVGFGVAVFQARPVPPSSFSARVLDSITREPIAEAKVTLVIEGPADTRTTDSDGVFSFWFRPPATAMDGWLRVEHEDYKPFSKVIQAQRLSPLADVMLVRTARPPIELVPKPVPTNRPAPPPIGPVDAIGPAVPTPGQPAPAAAPVVSAPGLSGGVPVVDGRKFQRHVTVMVVHPSSINVADIRVDGARPLGIEKGAAGTLVTAPMGSRTLSVDGRDDCRHPMPSGTEGNLPIVLTCR